MPLTTAGAQFLAKAWTGLNSPTLFSASNFYVGVGDSSTAFATSQTDLVAASNKLRKLVTSVSESSGVVTAVATFGTSEANFEWAEWGTFNASSGGTMAGRKVESPTLGTKVGTQVWTLSCTVTFSA
jgi:hypothetical protein